MALRACKDCGSDVSSRAAACPRCGRPTMGTGRKVLNAFGLLWLLFLAVAGVVGFVAAFRLIE